MEMNIVSTNLKEGEKMTWLTYADEVDYTVRAPLKMVADYLYLLGQKSTNDLAAVSMTLETILSRWENLDRFFRENSQ